MTNGGRHKLGLGTAQFGLPYGISGPGYRVAPDEVGEIVKLAEACAVTLLDTAPAYGDSERIVGERLPAHHEFAIVTKTVPLRAQRVDAAAIEHVERTFAQSLQRLRRRSVYAVLVHTASDLLVPGGERLYGCAVRWRADGRATKIGVSVYTKDELEALLARYTFDLVQVPVNVLDQRLVIDGTLARLKARGIELHARSVFLQGLLLMEPRDIPQTAARARPFVTRFREMMAKSGVSPLAAALRYVARLSEIDRIIVGVHSAAQLSECVRALDDATMLPDCADLRCDDERAIDPRRWVTV